MTLPVQIIALVLLYCGLVAAAPAFADESCSATGSTADDVLVAEMTCLTPSGDDAGTTTETEAHESPAFVEYEYRSPCPGADGRATSLDCAAATLCTTPGERAWQLYGLLPPPTSEWRFLGSECLGEPPTAEDTPRPQVTPALVLNALRRVGLPTLQARTQPEGKTLVNFATIFYTEAEPFTTTLTLLGQQVDVEAAPTQYTWHHGDGSSATTSGPGAPYPSKEVTHHYSDADVTVRPSVDVTYTARFRVNGGAWQDIDETVAVSGPQGSLRVTEATALLAGYG